MATPNEIWVSPLSDKPKAWTVEADNSLTENDIPAGQRWEIAVDMVDGVMTQDQADVIRDFICEQVEHGTLDAVCGQGIQYPTGGSPELKQHLVYLRCWTDECGVEVRAHMGVSSSANWVDGSPPQASPEDLPSTFLLEESNSDVGVVGYGEVPVWCGQDCVCLPNDCAEAEAEEEEEAEAEAEEEEEAEEAEEEEEAVDRDIDDA